jgi:hypothetical protein
MNPLRPGQAERIAHLFRRGYSLDLVAELGLLYGWSRLQAKDVVASHGWALDYAGRLQPQFVQAKKPTWPTVADADSERLLNVGIDHEAVEVRKAAVAAEKAVEKLRSAMLRQEQRDANDAMASKREKAAETASRTIQDFLGLAPAPRTSESSDSSS